MSLLLEARHRVPLRPRQPRRGDAAPRPRGRAHPHHPHVPGLGGRRRVQRGAWPQALLRPADRRRHRLRRQPGRPPPRRTSSTRVASTRPTSAGCRTTASGAPSATASTSPSAASGCARPSAAPTAATPRSSQLKPGDVDWDALFGDERRPVVPHRRHLRRPVGDDAAVAKEAMTAAQEARHDRLLRPQLPALALEVDRRQGAGAAR